MGSGAALSLDLRTRAVEAYHNGEGRLQEIADRFSIGRTTLCDLLRLERRTGSLEPAKTRGRPPRRVDETGRERIRRLVEKQPDATIEELTDVYNACSDSGSRISPATMGREIRRLSITRKKRL